MDTSFILASFDLHCEWKNTPPAYRIYLNNELFTERTWEWRDAYLKNTLQIQGPSGEYKVRIEPVQPCDAKFWATNHAIEQGPAEWANQHRLIIKGN